MTTAVVLALLVLALLALTGGDGPRFLLRDHRSGRR